MKKKTKKDNTSRYELYSDMFLNDISFMKRLCDIGEFYKADYDDGKVKRSCLILIELILRRMKRILNELKSNDTEVSSKGV